MDRLERKARTLLHDNLRERGEIIEQLKNELQETEIINRQLDAENMHLRALLHKIFTLANSALPYLFDRALLDEVESTLHPKPQVRRPS